MLNVHARGTSKTIRANTMCATCGVKRFLSILTVQLFLLNRSHLLTTTYVPNLHCLSISKTISFITVYASLGCHSPSRFFHTLILTHMGESIKRLFNKSPNEATCRWRRTARVVISSGTHTLKANTQSESSYEVSMREISCI